MSTLDTLVIAGASHAGGRAAQAIRAAGFAGRVILIGEEAWIPYERPPLSKALLVGEEGIEKVQLHPRVFYEERTIELVLGERVTAIDRAARQVKVGGKAIAYDRLMLATGARVRRIELPGATLPGVTYLRTIDDSASIRAKLKEGMKVIVIGGGFIGLETAASARKRGCTVTVIEAADRLMGRALAPEVGEYFAKLHRSKGTEVRLSTTLLHFEGEGKLERVMFPDGSSIPADLCIVGIGITPNVELALEAGLEVHNGVVVDDRGRTSDPNIFAVGDVANQPNAFLGRRVRLESYQNAQDQGMTVGRNMAGADEAYEDRLWVWTDQYETNLQMLGQPQEWDRLVFRGDVEKGSFVVFYLKDGKVVGVNAVNSGRDIRTCERLMASGATVTADQLADPTTNLRKIGA
jgi:3-phenylpropionate/trans-cinnamate dioxygenase ferredoxin reductase component